MSKAPFEVVQVTEAELRRIWVTPVEFTARFTEDVFDKRWERVRDKMRRALSRRWKEGFESGDDFMVSDDRNNAWTQCGGVYTTRVCCPLYAVTILEVLASDADADKWAYHTAVETWRPESGLPAVPSHVAGQFVLKSGRMYVPNDGYDYSPFLSNGAD